MYRNDVKCPYCSDIFIRNRLPEHIEYAHHKEHTAKLKRGKITRVFALVGLSFLMGMIYMMVIL